MNKHLIIAITGGFATGKTTVAKIIEEKGYPVVYTDTIAKDLMNNDPEIKAQIIDLFGEKAFNSENQLNSQYIADIVFNDTKMLEQLNRIVHPKVIDSMEKSLFNYVNQGKTLIFVESALIFEAALQDGFDYIICVSCDKELQIKRAVTKHKLSNEQVIKRLEAQLDLKIKEQHSDFIIKNNGSLEELRNSTMLILNILNAHINT